MESSKGGEGQASDRQSEHVVKESSKEWNGGSEEISSNMGVNTPLTVDGGSMHEKEHQQDNIVIRSDEMMKKNYPEVQRKEAPNLIDESEEEIQHRKVSEEDD
ncbi:hypothetical protein KY290_005681 [Solanum tuberosum]|uniref:Uncharacterized protein n=1 Tax=Solanum tuberosum TaxID=4113 RepID=A0ABQ7WEU7_SOLTU|nr:hypothetical protein KY289_006057 [Solanum tuberosum]KAH0779254.1 hypothetical protein KY290_005681 [Solanum tuberosum]